MATPALYGVAPEPIRLVVPGAPRTKKNHMRIVRIKGRPALIQGASYKGWASVAIALLRAQWMRSYAAREAVLYGASVIGYPVNLRALVYRERAGRADLLNYLAAVSDVLEEAGVLVDDKLVAGLDGSRLLVDRARPRVEIELRPMVD